MRSDQKLWEICMEIYRKMYKNASPSTDFDKLIKTGESRKQNFFLHYYLPLNEQEQIFDEICKKHKCIKQEKDKISFEFFLGASPNSCKKTWKQQCKK